jgi:hypothetical protein
VGGHQVGVSPPPCRLDLAIRIPLLGDLDLRINQPNSTVFGEDHEGSVKLSVILRQDFQFDRSRFWFDVVLTLRAEEPLILPSFLSQFES